MKKGINLLALVSGLLLIIGTNVAADDIINGAGASFPYPVYSQWAYKYNQITGVKVNYQSIGSGGGIAQIKAKTVDFGASDAPLKAEELDAAGLIQFPMLMGGIVPVINVKGIKEGSLKLTPQLLADIFLGKIKMWNDPAIKKINPGLNLPNRKITVVHRADGSGSTWIFTNYLTKVSETWKNEVGEGKSVSWPAGVGGKGNEGVSSYVTRIDGSIGYVEFAYAIQNKLNYVLLRNKAGEFAAPSMKSFQAAAANADWINSAAFYVVLTDQPGKESWPITGATFILLYRNQDNATEALRMLKFFDWGYRHGTEIAEKLHYVPMPEKVIEIVRKTWKEEIKAAGRAIWK